MARQALVIGLGQFGMALARALSERRVEVLAVDRDRGRTQVAASFVSEARAFDATSEDALARTAPSRMDICVCTIGAESRDSAFIVTALLRQMGAPMIWARASDDLTERILRLIGAHAVVNPERAFGLRLASQLVHDRIVDEIPLGDGLVLTELRPPAAFTGRNLTELALERRHGLKVVAVQKLGRGRPEFVVPNPEEDLCEDEMIVVIGAPRAVEAMLEKY